MTNAAARMSPSAVILAHNQSRVRWRMTFIEKSQSTNLLPYFQRDIKFGLVKPMIPPIAYEHSYRYTLFLKSNLETDLSHVATIQLVEIWPTDSFGPHCSLRGRPWIQSHPSVALLCRSRCAP